MDGMQPERHPAAAVRLPAARRAASRTRSRARAVLSPPLARRTWAETAYLAVSVPLSAAGFVAILLLMVCGGVLCASLAGAVAGLALLTWVTAAGRGLAALHRRLAATLLGLPAGGGRLPAPAPYAPGLGMLGRADARLRDGPGWRGACYVLIRLPVALASLYVIFVFWVAALYDLTFPAWYGISQAVTGPRHALPGPLRDLLPAGGVTSWPQALALSVIGVFFVLAAPWMVRLVVLADRWLIRRLLTARPLAERVRELQARRAQAVDASAATLRRVERDLHDGAQARLVAVAMQLGLAREKLSARGEDGGAADVEAARDLVDAAHRGAKEALTELRDLARGIHPPALDHGLAEALATLAARSAVPATLRADVPVRPTAAIETIAYFCAAELLANVAKHSGATRATVDVAVTRRGPGPGALRLSVTDDGSGGAVLRAGGGLAGLAQRVAVVDGTLTVCSPDGGPTVVTAGLPLHA
jgi:signal transduction histidine kinase